MSHSISAAIPAHRIFLELTLLVALPLAVLCAGAYFTATELAPVAKADHGQAYARRG